jgi:hypothetical protein
MKKIYEKANIKEIDKLKNYLIYSLEINSDGCLTDEDKETIIHLISRYKILEKQSDAQAEAQR